HDVRAAGGRLVLDCEVLSADASARGLRLRHAGGETVAGGVIFCAGAWADRVARGAGAEPEPRILPFRGAYLRVADERAPLVRALIYPVPDPALPFLGVHLTRTVQGELLIGPSALPAGRRDPHGGMRAHARDLKDVLAWSGTWRMAAHWWRTGATELRHALLRRSLLRAGARYVPELRGAKTQRAFAGVRAQALARDGSLVDDFVFTRTERAVHVRSAPSPGATAALAIARHVADEAERALAV